MTMEIQQWRYSNGEKLLFGDRYASCWHLKQTVAKHNNTEKSLEAGDECNGLRVLTKPDRHLCLFLDIFFGY